jgi:Bacteriophage minor capsid protein
LTILDGLARYLHQQGLAVYDPTGAVETADWSLFIEAMPPQGDQVIGLFQYAASESDVANPWDDTNVQARVRAQEDPRVSRTRAQAIYDRLHGLGPLALPDGTWLQLAAGTQGGPVPLGPDPRGRHEHTVNFRIEFDNPSLNRPAT